VRISAWKNPQKQRKPNPDPSLRSRSYWDLAGRYQAEYDARLDMLPEVGVADTVSEFLLSVFSRSGDGQHFAHHSRSILGLIGGAGGAGVLLLGEEGPGIGLGWRGGGVAPRSPGGRRMLFSTAHSSAPPPPPLPVARSF
jgi:hypothetical protein